MVCAENFENMGVVRIECPEEEAMSRPIQRITQAPLLYEGF
jgi:hypothetical protein